MGERDEITLCVLVCAYGPDALKSILQGCYPEVDGVGYLVSWQASGGAPVPEAIAAREDFRVERVDGTGLSCNRNHTLHMADAPFCLVADDDLVYSAEGLAALRDYWLTHPDADILTCHIMEGGKLLPTFSSGEFYLTEPPEGYYYTSVEISFRLGAVRQSGVRFEELMGVGAPELVCGEEEVFVRSLLWKGLRGICVPIVLGDHPDTSTGNQLKRHPGFVKTQGALLRFRYPHTWLAMLPLSAVKRARHTLGLCRWPLVMKMMFEGAVYTKRHNMFKSRR